LFKEPILPNPGFLGFTFPWKSVQFAPRVALVGKATLYFPEIKQVFGMVTIRLSRGGSKKRPFYHVLVTDSRSPRDSRYIERVGYYNPMASKGEIPLSMQMERVQHWISKGAQPSERVAHLIERLQKSVAKA
jgi:small subunit ribosomal protein S16